jgi:uncharacterized protein YegL
MTTTTVEPVALVVPELSPEETDALVHRVAVMAAGLTGEREIDVRPSGRWWTDLEERVLYYDLGLAARLSALARQGVIAHEIGHLRYTGKFRFPKGLSMEDMKWAKMLENLFEDRRIELLMADEFPGIAPGLAKLRSAFTARNVKDTIAKSSPHMQFINGLYSIIFEEQAIASHPDVLVALNDHGLEARKAVLEPTTAGMVRMLIGDKSGVRKASIFETLLRLRELGRDEAAVRAEHSPPPPPPPDDPEDADLMPEPAVLPEDAGLDLPDPEDEPDPEVGSGGDPLAESVAADGDGGAEGHVDLDDLDGDDEDLDAGDDNGPTPVMEELDEDDLESLTSDAEEMLDEALKDAVDNDGLDDDEHDLAKQLAEMLDDAQEEKAGVSENMRKASAQRGMIADDIAFELPDDADEYDYEIYPRIEKPSSVFGRELDSILEENRMDRYSVIGYESGVRIHRGKLAQAGIGNSRIFRRRTSRQNRNFAVALLSDCSSSMNGRRIEQACVATSMLAESFDIVRGSELAVYAFASQIACLVPFDMAFFERRGRVAEMGKPEFRNDYPTSNEVTRKLGGLTNMAEALERAKADITDKYGADYQRMIITVTDGQPNDKDPTKAKVAECGRLGIECIAVGIELNDDSAKIVSECFPHHVGVDDAQQLPKMLTNLLSKRIRKV